MLQYFNIKFGNWSERNSRYLSVWHSDMELENLLDPGTPKVLDMDKVVDPDPH